MMPVQWENPPPRQRRGGGQPLKWVPLLEPLMERPGQWARIAEYRKSETATQAAGNLRNGAVRIPPGEWEFAPRKLAENTSALWARYIGPNGAAS